MVHGRIVKVYYLDLIPKWCPRLQLVYEATDIFMSLAFLSVLTPFYCLECWNTRIDSGTLSLLRRDALVRAQGGRQMEGILPLFFTVSLLAFIAFSDRATRLMFISIEIIEANTDSINWVCFSSMIWLVSNLGKECSGCSSLSYHRHS